VPEEVPAEEVPKKNMTKGYGRKPLRCRLGLHKWGIKMYHEEKDSYVEHSTEICIYCGKERKGTQKMAWDKSK
jgi:hypothetical protein